jgi:hypothetical protein
VLPNGLPLPFNCISEDGDCVFLRKLPIGKIDKVAEVTKSTKILLVAKVAEVAN